MRTTLTVEADVAALLESLRRERGTSLRELVNEALRRGLQEMVGQRRSRIPFRTRSVDLGGLRVASIDNISEALAIAEDEAFR